ncbi:hypothetical protein [Actinoplanes sp. NPDC026670]|uniref:hypothetical protein n=1 Tax=Actinoplanes sp. NPDC026670 TaxID=3154700 RepID=UPI0033F59CBB
MSDSPPGSISPSRAWELGTGALLLAIAGAGGFVITSLVLAAVLISFLRSDDVDPPPLANWIIEEADTVVGIEVLGFVLTIVYIIGFFVWRSRTRALVRGFGIDPKSLTKHPGVTTWAVASIMSYCLGRAANVNDTQSLDGVTGLLHLATFAGVLRLVGLASLAVGIVGIRRRVHMSLAYHLPVFTPPPAYAMAPAAQPDPVSPPAPARDVPGIDGLPYADEDFWHRVRQAATGADLALLETSGPNTHRWVLVPADQDPAAVRDSLAPGSAITVFTEPPARRPTTGYRPAAAAEYHGLLESAVTGALWYQSVTPRRLTGFLDRAETGGRWALYPVDDPNSLTARLP